jgi:hypothetical protein
MIALHFQRTSKGAAADLHTILHKLHASIPYFRVMLEPIEASVKKKGNFQSYTAQMA